MRGLATYGRMNSRFFVENLKCEGAAVIASLVLFVRVRLFSEYCICWQNAARCGLGRIRTAHGQAPTLSACSASFWLRYLARAASGFPQTPKYGSLPCS